jgi:alpha-tubulin suppressor-like RCC1 family protein
VVDAAIAGVAPTDSTAVRVVDEDGDPVVGVEVRFRVVGGGGHVDPRVATTDDAGVARTLWTLGQDPGQNLLLAELAGTGVSITLQTRGERGLVGVTAGLRHTCVLFSTGEAACWGDNHAGQLATGDAEPSLTPTDVLGGVRFESLSAGYDHTCGLDRGGAGYCWGDNGMGQLGTGDFQRRYFATRVRGTASFATLSAGYQHTCGASDTGEGYCWGLDEQGALGDGAAALSCTSPFTTQCSPEPLRVASSAAYDTIAAGGTHSCALTSDGRVECWGSNFRGEVGAGLEMGTFVASPQPVSGDGYVQLALGLWYSCALHTSGAVDCWGRSWYGEGGRPPFWDVTTPLRMEAPQRFTTMRTGERFSCALDADGAAWCWGALLGDGTAAQDHVPTHVSSDLHFIGLAAGTAHACANTATEVWCWGDNSHGQLGDGTRETRLAPVRVLLPEPSK